MANGKVACTFRGCHWHRKDKNSKSNFPKSKNDCSPGGIGLKHVDSRLKMSYPGRYTWEYGPTADGAAYRSEIHVWE